MADNDDIIGDLDLIFGGRPDADGRRARLVAELAAALDADRPASSTDETAAEIAGADPGLPADALQRAHAALAASPGARADLGSARDLIAGVEAAPERAPAALIERARLAMPVQDSPNLLARLLRRPSARAAGFGMGLAAVTAVGLALVMAPFSTPMTGSRPPQAGTPPPGHGPDIAPPGPPGRLVDVNGRGEEGVARPPLVPAIPPADWNAFVRLDPGGAVSAVSRERSKAAAEQAALLNCRTDTDQPRPNCQVRYSGEAACFTVAQRPSNGEAFAGVGANAQAARAAALASCQAGGAVCALVHASCEPP